MTIAQAGHIIELYEIYFKEANVIWGIKQAAVITVYDVLRIIL
jgi:hypothetical protein